jgi:hypothetical protein
LRTAPAVGPRSWHRRAQFFEVAAHEFLAAPADLRNAGHGLSAITHPRQRASTVEALFLAALVCFQPNLFLSIGFPLVDRG